MVAALCAALTAVVVWLMVVAGASAHEPLAIASAPLARKAAMRIIWGIPRLPRAQPTVTLDIRDHRFAGYPNLARIDRLETTTRGYRSIAYLLRPARSNGRLIVYHAGHLVGFEAYAGILRFFLRRGYTVLGMSMPLVGMNGPAGAPPLVSHNRMAGLAHPLQYFFTPVAANLNYLTRRRWRSISMIGLSGGGWTTTVYGALDPRIDELYPVAGSMPETMYPALTSGDFEQWYPPLLRKLDYSQLYVLGALHRRELQILNMDDPCCFQGRRYLRHPYASAVQRYVDHLGGGRFGVWVDRHEKLHAVSPSALRLVARDIARQR